MNVTVVLENVRSLYNVGAVIRACDGTGVARLIACGITPYPPLGAADARRGPVQTRAERELRKTALAAYESVQVEHAPDATQAIQELRSEDTTVVAVETAPNAESLWSAPALDRRPLALLFGHETEGLSPALLTLADATICVPMRGHGNSLNIATAAAVVLYETLRQESQSAGTA